MERTKKQQQELESITRLVELTAKLNQFTDINSILDGILFEARRFTNADAGSIFLIDNNQLKFSYVQNDTLEARDYTHNKHQYMDLTLPIDDKSIAGYVALTGKSLLIDDVYKLDQNTSYCFNSFFDKQYDYKTRAILTVPLITGNTTIIGIMQIINAKNKKGELVSFTEKDARYVSFFANNASIAIERAKMTREIILRMIRMAELRDPKETGAHVNRVGSYVIEIYQQWAKNKGISKSEIIWKKDLLRIAAMLHDVGKVAISDSILKKPAKLTDKEYEIMKTHTFQGADLFSDTVSELDKLSAQIAFTHHEKWDGSGYPHGLMREEIPIAGRITALADVYDALICKRVYKDAWAEKDVLDYLKEQSGKHFDPEVIEAFLSIYDIINAIRGKYQD